MPLCLKQWSGRYREQPGNNTGTTTEVVVTGFLILRPRLPFCFSSGGILKRSPTMERPRGGKGGASPPNPRYGLQRSLGGSNLICFLPTILIGGCVFFSCAKPGRSRASNPSASFPGLIIFLSYYFFIGERMP